MIDMEKDTRSDVRSPRILIVEDEAIIAMRTERLLTQLGYEVIGMAPTGEEGLQIVVERHPDLVLMDIKLAGALDGVETAAQIRAEFDVPVIYLSAHPERMIQEDVKRTQHYSFLSKPVQGQELRGTVDMALYKHRLEVKLRESEATARALLKAPTDVAALIDTEGVILDANETMARRVDKPIDELIGMTVWELFPPDVTEYRKAILARVVESGQPVRVEDSGPGIWYDTVVYPILDAQNEVSRIAIIARDITEKRRMEEALRESERNLAEAQRIAHLGSWEMDIATGKSRWSDEFFRICGYEPGAFEPTAEKGFQIIHPEDRESAEAALNTAIEKGQTYEVEKRIVRPDGEVRVVLARGKVMCDTDGQPLKLVGTMQDITERKQAEEALHTRLHYEKNLALVSKTLLSGSSPEDNVSMALDYLREAAGAARVYIFENFVDGQDDLCMRQTQESCAPGVQSQIDNLELGHLPYADGFERWVDLLSRGEPIRGQVAEFPPEEQAILAPQDIRSILVLPVFVQQEWHGFIGFDETRVAREWQDDDVRLLRTAAEMIGSYVERKQTEEALRESEERFRGVFETSPTGIAIVDTMTQQFLEANASYLQILGYSLEELQHLTVMDVTHPDDWERESEMIDAYLGDSLPNYVVEKRYVRKRGEIRWVRTTGDVLFVDPDAPPLAIANVVDITERKQAEDAVRATKERLEILHEIDAAILAAQSPADIAQAALKRLHDLVPYQRASVSKIDPTRERRRDVVVLTYSDEGVKEVASSAWQPLSQGKVIKAARRGQTHVVPDLAALKKPTHLERYLEAQGVKSYVSAPLIFRGKLMGSLNLTMDQPNSFRPEHIEILEEIASSLAVAVQQANLLEQTRRDAETKTLLLHDVNHRVANNLAMIASILELEKQRPLEDREDFQASLQDIYGRVQGMITVHHMLSVRRDVLDLGEIVTQIVHLALSGSPIQHRVAVTVEAPDDLPRVSAKQATILALIVNELTTNSVKYAFANRSQGRIHVQITPVDDDLGDRDGLRKMRLVYRDDGPGIPDKALVGDWRSVGLSLVQGSATHTLDGTIEWYNDDGAVVEITFAPAPPDWSSLREK